MLKFSRMLSYHPTRSSFLWSRILKTPFWAILCLLPFILYRDLGATPFQVALMTALKPASALLSFYWSTKVSGGGEPLRRTIIFATVFGAVPFFLFPFVDSIWFFIFAYGAFMFFHRGVIPAWMELIKRDVPEDEREKTFAKANLFGYLGDAVFPFLFGPLCDSFQGIWRWIFFATALISLASIFWQLKLSSAKMDRVKKFQSPWKEAISLVKERPDFGKFQVGFMFGGAGLMVMQAVLPQYMMGVLNVSYTELAIALTLCKGIGVALSSHFWAENLRRTNLFIFCSRVTLLAALFPLLLFFAKLEFGALFLAHVVYGVMQAASELAWNLSGPLFAPNEDSSLYSGVNVLTVGLRGLVAPFFAVLLFEQTGSPAVLLLGGVLCLMATAWMKRSARECPSAIPLR